MREILFKAKRKNWKELPKEQWWVKGYLWNGNDHSYIIPYNFGIGYDSDTNSLRATAYEIDKDTICQYTGLTDKNGNKIWENDIVCTPYVDPIFGDMVNDEIINDFRWKVVFYEGMFCVENENKRIYLRDFTNGKHIEVIGNIFDNQDLLQ